MADGAALPSKSHINRCGQALVEYWHGGPQAPTRPHVSEADAVAVLNAFRRAHAMPLLKVRMGLVSFVHTENVRGVVTQRLKRRPRIVRKLARMDNSMLARLEDVGGCRVVFARHDDLYVVLEHIREVWRDSLVRERDYITEPNAVGYRAFHVVVERDSRRIEIQLRTRGQQEWADAVEAADSRHNLTLKDGHGPSEMVEYFAATSDVIYANEYGVTITSEEFARFTTARDAVVAAGYYRM